MRIAATGHRPQKLQADFKSSELLMAALRWLTHHYIEKKQGSITEAISGMALGWDQAWALEALEAGIPLTAAIPCDDQDRPWSPTERKTYKAILRRVTKITVVSPGKYEPWKMHARNRWMVVHCDHVVALWNGNASGGTAACIKLIGPRQYDNLWPEYLRLQQVVRTKSQSWHSRYRPHSG